MSTVKVDTIKPVTSGAALSLQGDSGGAAVDCLNIDSSGDIDFSGNTNAKIKLPSAGGIYESDGSTAILTESGAAVTLNNVTLGSSVTGQGVVKAWVNFDGEGTVAIRDSFNVSSVSDAGTGQYTINFTNNLANANYAPSGNASVWGTELASVRHLALAVGSYNLQVIDTTYKDAGIITDIVCGD